MIDTVHRLAVSSSSIGAIEVVNQSEIPSGLLSGETVKLFLQLVIAVVGLVGLLKKKQPITTK